MGDVIILIGEREMRITHEDFFARKKVGGFWSTGRRAEHWVKLDESNASEPLEYGVLHDARGVVIEKEKKLGGHGVNVSWERGFTPLFCHTDTNTPALVDDVTFPHLSEAVTVIHEHGRVGTIDVTATEVPIRPLLSQGR